MTKDNEKLRKDFEKNQKAAKKPRPSSLGSGSAFGFNISSVPFGNFFKDCIDLFKKPEFVVLTAIATIGGLGSSAILGAFSFVFSESNSDAATKLLLVFLLLMISLAGMIFILGYLFGISFFALISSIIAILVFILLLVAVIELTRFVGLVDILTCVISNDDPTASWPKNSLISMFKICM